MRYLKKAEKVSIVTILGDFFGIEAAHGEEGFKTQCPIGYEHSDGGSANALRVYPSSNSSWCFSHSQRFGPIELAELYFNLPRVQAARSLLQHYGISLHPPTTDQRWATLQESRVHRPDTGVLRELFLKKARSLPGYDTHQYDPEVTAVVSKILRSAEDMGFDPTEEDVEKWLQTSEKIMKALWKKHGLDNVSLT